MGQVIPLPTIPGPTSRPENLDPKHVLAGFYSGEPSLDDWLAKRALANQVIGASRTYVICEQDVVVGYYYIAAGAVARDEATPALRRNMPDPIPVMVLGRLAVRLERAGQGIGGELLAHAVYRTVKAAEIAGVAALLVHALHGVAAKFYLRHGFHPSPSGELMLMLPLREMRVNLPR